MGGLIWALAAFIGTHFLLSHPMRAPIVARIGGAAFQGIYSLVAFATLYWVYVAFLAAPRGEDLWAVTPFLWGVATFIMLLGSILFAGSLIGNPAMPNPGAAKLTANPARGVFAITRHPMMWGFACWAIVHAIVAPYPASLILTSGIALLALGGSKGQDIKKAVLMGDGWKDWSMRTSFIPFGNQMSGTTGWASAWPGRTAALGGIAIWLGATYVHPLLGGPVAGIWRWMAG